MIIIEHWCIADIQLEAYLQHREYMIRGKNLYPLVNVSFAGRFSLAIFSMKAFVNDDVSTRLQCQTSEKSKKYSKTQPAIFFNTRGLAFMRKMVTLHPTWRTVIKANGGFTLLP